MAHLSTVESSRVVKIEPSDIKYLVLELEKLRGSGVSKGFETQVSILLKRHGVNKSSKIFAIIERMRCLVDLMEDDRMRGWTLQGTVEGCTLTHEAVFAATATCRLIYRDEHFSFDPDEFFRVALRHTPGEAKA